MNNKQIIRLGRTQKKVLLLLLGGLALGLSGSPKQYFKILKEVKKEWKEIDNPSGKRSIKSLKQTGMLQEKRNRDGSVRLVLTKKGKNVAEELSIHDIVIPKRKQIIWDGKWRIVMFDIPEKKRHGRDALRYHLKRLGFVEVQKSVFAFPFVAIEQVQIITDFYIIRPYVKFIVADTMSDDYKLKKHFKIQNPR